MTPLRVSEEDIRWVNEFRDNAIRAISLRLRIVRDRYNAIRLLKNNLQSEEGLALLKRTTKNEIWFNRIIEKGLGESQHKLKEIYSFMSKDLKDKEPEKKVKKLLELVDYFYLNLKDIEKRLLLEEAFLERKDSQSFKRFLAEWEEDFKIRKTAINKIAGVSALAEYFRVKKGYMDSIVISGLKGLGLGSLSQVINTLQTGEQPGKLSAEIIGAFTITWIIGDIILNLVALEKKIYMDEFVELESAVRDSRIQERRRRGIL